MRLRACDHYLAALAGLIALYSASTVFHEVIIMLTLIVEDEFSSRLILQRLLSAYGEVHIAVNGWEAVAAYKNSFEQGFHYDLICLDIGLPEMNGHQVLHEIRAIENQSHLKSRSKVKIIMTTGMDDPKNVASAFHEYCDGYLIKPIRKETLISQLKELELIEG